MMKSFVSLSLMLMAGFVVFADEANKVGKKNDDAKEGWVQLFNGKDLTGWKAHPDDKAKWEVKDGILIGSGPKGHLFSEKGDYENFRYRVEAMINDHGNSGQFLASPRATRLRSTARTATQSAPEACIRHLARNSRKKTRKRFSSSRRFISLMSGSRRRSSPRATTSSSKSTVKRPSISWTRITPTPKATLPCNSTTPARW